MSVLTILAIVFGSIFTYFGIGGFLAKKNIEWLWARAKRVSYSFSEREDVYAWVYGLIFLWPIIGPILAVINMVDTNDPREVRRRLEESERQRKKALRELEDMERWAGIRHD